MPDKITYVFDLKSGERSAVVDTQALVRASDQLQENFAALDRHSQAMVSHLEAMTQKMRQGQPLNRQEQRHYESRVKSLKEHAHVTRMASQLETDASRRRRTEARAEALEGAAMRYGGLGPGARGGAAGAMRGPLARFLDWTPGAGTAARFPRAWTMSGLPEPSGTMAERIGGAMRGVRETVASGITTGMGMIGLFEGLSMVARAMAEVEQRERGITTVGAMMGGSFDAVRNRIDDVRKAWGFLSEESLGAASAMVRAGGIMNRGGVMGAGLFSRAFGMPIKEAAGALGTFERYTRGGRLGTAPGFVAGDTGAMEAYIAEVHRETAALKPLATPARPDIMTAGGAVARGVARAGKSDPRIAMLEAASDVRELTPGEEALLAGLVAAEAPGGVRAEDRTRDATWKSKMARRKADIMAEKAGPLMIGGAKAATGVSGESFEAILARAFERSGLMLAGAPGAMGAEFLRSAGGLARTFAGRGGMADPKMVAGLLGLAAGGTAWGGGTDVGMEPERAADMLGRLFGGTAGMGDEVAYTLKVRALAGMGPMTVMSAAGRPIKLDPRNPYHLRSILERGINTKGVLDSYMEEAKRFGPDLAPRALVTMAGGAISEMEARDLLAGTWDTSKFLEGKGGGKGIFDLAKKAMATEGGKAIMMEADIERNMEQLGHALHDLRLEIRDSIGKIVAAAGTDGVVGAAKELVTALKEHPRLLATLLIGHGLKNPVDITGAASLVSGIGLMVAAD